MEMETLTLRIEGKTPLVMHNARLADPIDPAAIAVAEIAGKRKKTRADHEELARREWRGGLYTDDAGRPALTGEQIEKVIIEGARKVRAGKEAECGILCDGVWAIDYDGPKDLDALCEDLRFRDRRSVVVSRRRVMRTRPRFDAWSATFKVMFNPEVLNASAVEDGLRRGGRLVGIGDYRPRFGRFEIIGA